MTAISTDLRKRIVRAYRNKEGTYEEIAARFDVGYATVSRLLSRFRATGSVLRAPPGGGNPPRIAAAEYPRLSELVRRHPDATQEELCVLWEEAYGRSVSEAAMGRTLKRAGITRKKNDSDRGKSFGRTSKASGKGS